MPDTKFTLRPIVLINNHMVTGHQYNIVHTNYGCNYTNGLKEKYTTHCCIKCETCDTPRKMLRNRTKQCYFPARQLRSQLHTFLFLFWTIASFSDFFFLLTFNSFLLSDFSSFLILFFFVFTFCIAGLVAGACFVSSSVSVALESTSGGGSRCCFTERTTTSQQGLTGRANVRQAALHLNTILIFSLKHN